MLRKLLAAAVVVLWLYQAPAAVGGELLIQVQSFPPGQPLKPGMAVILSMEGLEPGLIPVWHRVEMPGNVVYWVLSITRDGPPIDDPPEPPPDDLSVFTADLLAGLSLNGSEVAGMFSGAIPKIKSGKLRGSRAIVQAVSKPIADLKSVKWQSFSTLLFQHLLNERKLVTQAQWAEAYQSIVVGLASKGDGE